MNRTFIIAILLLPLFVWAQPEPTAPLSPAESKARIQQLGNALRKYDSFEYFNENGWMVVTIMTEETEYSWSTHYGIIDDKGQTVLPCKYSCIRFQENSDLMMVAKNAMSAGFMNRQLEWVIPPKYNEQPWCDLGTDNLFSYGMIVVEDSSLKYGVVDSLGNEVLPCRYQELVIAGADLFVINEDKAGAINRNGDTVIPFIYEHLRFFGNHYFEAKKEGRYGVISILGREILPFVYESVLDCDNGFFSVSQNGKWGVVDSTGKVVIPLKYETQHMWFKAGMDLVEMGGLYMNNGMDRDDPEKCTLLNMKGEVLVQGYDASIPGKSPERIAFLFNDGNNGVSCEIYDRTGKKVDAFDEISFDGIDLVDDITMIPVKRNGKWGFVNRDFQLIVPCRYTGVLECGRGYGSITTSDIQTLLIDERGDTLVKGPYLRIIPSFDGLFEVLATVPFMGERKTGFIDRYGNSTFTEEETVDRDDIESSEYTLPDFPGGMDSLHHYLARNITLPEDAREKGVFGTVLAHFVVEKDGSIGEVSIKVPLYPSCDEEVKRVLMQMPRWTPGTNQGLPERRYYAIPVTFLRPDTIYPKIITDAVLIDSLKAILKSSASPDEDFTRFNLEEADYYQLGNYYVVRCMLAGLISGYGSNFQHYFVIDVQNRKDFYFMSLSNNMKNMYIAGDLIINSVDYADGYNDDSQYFKKKKATFKLTTQRISTTDLQVKKTKQSDDKLDWREVSGWRLY
ncbi:MAG: WG repeat-containing protein [Bacteroidales bacterium]|nr:WG repeat-containing protein [Bacteroidales bacterium]